MSEFHRLRAYLERRAAFTEEDFAFLEPLFLPRVLRAGQFLQRAGDGTMYGAFVGTGCLRKYVIDARGKEHIVQFAPEEWWVGEGPGVAPGTPAKYFIDAIEDSNLLLFDSASHQRAIERLPAYAAGFRDGLQRHAVAKDQRIVNALSESAEDRY
jgi:CRP/FNR family transcriptional regulator, anaerobic regulatory protein